MSCSKQLSRGLRQRAKGEAVILVSAYMPRELAEGVRRVAFEGGETISAVVTRAVARELARDEPPDAA